MEGVIYHKGTSRIPFLDFWPTRLITGAIIAYCLVVCLKLSCSECPHTSSVLWHGYKAKATYSQSTNSKPHKTLNWGNWFCTVLSSFVQYTRMGPSHWRCIFHVENCMKPWTGAVYFTRSLFFFSLQRDDHCLEAIDKPMKLRCKTSGCDISWFKITIPDKNAIVHTHHRPSQGRFT